MTQTLFLALDGVLADFDKTAGAILDALDTVQVGTGDPPGLTRESATPSRGAGAERTVPALVEPARSSRAADAVVRGL